MFVLQICLKLYYKFNKYFRSILDIISVLPLQVQPRGVSEFRRFCDYGTCKISECLNNNKDIRGKLKVKYCLSNG